uniref:Uncharacterized protein n=1 Tax=Euplotes harpa TaxID=151035 RepID=A0A7S3J4G0_9SPIT|mmetsp:Transcript_19393/g.22585  ORF Transcript_19393/g.22585 Transcript_19393/m.22585 type:complete len:228 (+) Transcript_19393:851-1534(+)|eukprot:CAMPEP_0168333400 /NCGR_PEP_ID=MMETSP0213-20121227/9591_1 /TAXON_ID=151035 /ORGANISM="Euplotes harpa, Strain FSP1.4" /LENGTH=227 /DNA_ID=CAMNT_0008337729 /DNA_START=607 /DNA_END=1290 /DNA_ORIENTATION=-
MEDVLDGKIAEGNYLQRIAQLEEDIKNINVQYKEQIEKLNESLLQLKKSKKKYKLKLKRCKEARTHENCSESTLPSSLKETKFSIEADKQEGDYDELCKMIQTLRRPNGLEIDQNYVLEIIGTYNSDRDFIEKAKDLCMPYIKQLKMSSMHFYNNEDEIYEVNQFLSNTFTNELESLVLEGGNVDYSKFKSGITNILGFVNEEIHLSWFKIEEENLKSLIENTHQLK